MLKCLKILVLVFSLVLVSVNTGVADEGMWLPHQMKDLNLEAQGLSMDPGELFKKDGTGLMSAVVDLGGGTASFVSSQGLLLTNHHVAFGAIQRASDKEHDYIENGFLAKDLKEEIPAGGYNADVLLGYDDVTQEIMKAVKSGMTPLQRYYAIDKAKKRLIEKEERKAKDRRCEVEGFYSGNQYYLFKFKRLRDIRLVYAPPQSIGNFGGDIDNWMWPRHTCDFSYLRAYVSKDNVGTEYSADNVPYKPAAYFKISLDGLKEKDFTFVMGYPGITYRNFTLSQLQSDIAQTKERIELFKKYIDFFENAGKDSREIQIKYASRVKSLNNNMKNREGKLEGLEKTGIIAKKQAFEEKFNQWINNDPAKTKKYGLILKKIEDFSNVESAFMRKYNVFDTLTGYRAGVALLQQAYVIYRTSVENQKPDMEREQYFQQRDLPDIETRIKLAERGYDLGVDKVYFKYLLKNLLDKPADLRPALLNPVLEKGEAAVDKYVDDLYARTILTDPQKRLELLKLSPTALLKLNDPLIALAADFEKEFKALREKKKAIDQEMDDLEKVYQAALLEMFQGKIAPDANSTIRFTCGTVEGYHPKDAVDYNAFTTLKGVMEKETGEYPFYVPSKLKELYNTRDFGRYEAKDYHDVVTCFLNTTNVTGGNSGSPVLNAKGEQVGIVFDMTYESVIGDYYIIPELQRTIHVDLRYVMFITEKFSGALHLLKEMGL
ncbi:MAG TPA: S46 family peptidase [Candidatus Kapabacteria bacterium]|nr:S46 family peptidase [Candidatus Kapabacteria bacterium]